MRFFGRFSPILAYRDLRAFVATRERYEFAFFALAIVITFVVVFAFLRSGNVEVPYKRNIVYVQNWRLDRTDAQIKAQQVIDEAARQKLRAEQEADKARSRAEFQRLDNSLDRMGI